MKACALFMDTYKAGASLLAIPAWIFASKLAPNKIEKSPPPHGRGDRLDQLCQRFRQALLAEDDLEVRCFGYAFQYFQLAQTHEDGIALHQLR